MRPLVAEFIGPAGSGKTTLCRATAEALRRSGLNVVTKGSAPRAAEPSQQRRDGLRLAASRLREIMAPEFGERYSQDYWARRLEEVWRLYASAEPEADTVVLSDEGVLQTLRKAPQPLPQSVLSLLPLPDVVIHVLVPWHVGQMRLLTRESTETRTTKFAGARRWNRALNRAAFLLNDAGEAKTVQFLREWSRRYCTPPLSDDEIVVVLQQADFAPDDSQLRMGRLVALRRTLEGRSRWFDIDNTDEEAVSGAARHIADLLAGQVHSVLQRPGYDLASS